jgi:hypothetical protein
MKLTVGGVVAPTLALFALTALPAHADVTNGGFETGDFTGWVQTGDTGFSGVDFFSARSGTYGAFFGPTEVGGISQSFATVAATSYRVSFSLRLDDSSIPNSFSWSWNGVAQGLSFNNAAGFGYTDFSSVISATGATSTIAFNFRNPQSFWELDNVSVTIAAVPEPETYALMLAGVGALGAIARRRRTVELGSTPRAS